MYTVSRRSQVVVSIFILASVQIGCAWGEVTKEDGSGQVKLNALEAQAAGGDIEAQLELADLYRSRGDIEEAGRLLRDISFSGDVSSVISAVVRLEGMKVDIRKGFPELTDEEIAENHGSVGCTLVYGDDPDVAIETLVQEAWLQSMPAMIMLDFLYQHTMEGFEAQDPRILEYFKKAAEEGIPRCQLFYGKYLLTGFGIAKDREAAVGYLEGCGIVDGLFALIVDAYRRDDAETMERYYLKAATEYDDVMAIYNLGVINQQRGDYGEAVDYFKKAMELDPDRLDAQLELGRMYSEGWGVAEDPEKAFSMFKRVADKAEGRLKAIAETNIGLAYLGGRGTKTSQEEATKYFRRGADGGVEKARAIGRAQEAQEAGASTSPVEGRTDKTPVQEWAAKYIPNECLDPDQSTEVARACADEHFTFKGHPIHPAIIQDLTTWISDGGDQVISINLADSMRSNRYCCESDTVYICMTSELIRYSPGHLMPRSSFWLHGFSKNLVFA